MTKYTKFEQMAQEMFEDKAIPWIASSKSSDQKFIQTVQGQNDF